MPSSPATIPIAGPTEPARQPATGGRTRAVARAIVVAAVALVAFPAMSSAAAPTTVDLGSAASFVVLAGPALGPPACPG